MILVTGATGTVGSEVVRQLSDMEVGCRALIHTPAKALGIARPNVEIAYGDLDNIISLEKAMEGVDKLFLLSPSSQRQLELETNAVETAARAGVKHIVKLSVLGASPFTPIILGRWHWESEKMIEQSGIPFTFVRPTFFMSNIREYIQTAIAEGKLYAPMKDGTLNFIAPEDIASVAVAALTRERHEDKFYEITGPEELTMRQIAEKLSAVIGKPVEYVDIPIEAAQQAAIDSGLPDWLVDDMLWYYRYFSERIGSQITSIVYRVTGREPMSFDTWLEKHSEILQ